MARKHKRRTRKRNKRGGSVMAKMREGVQGWKNIGDGVKRKTLEANEGARNAFKEVERGFNERKQPGGMLSPVPAPPSSPPPMDPPMGPPMGPTMGLTKEKEAGGLLGLGWFGLGGRRLSHSAFINKMLRVRSKTKRNKAIRKYLKGGKKKTKTKKRRGSKKRRTKRRRR